MRAAAILEPGRIEVVEVPGVPDPVEDLVAVKILVAPMCSEARKRRTGPATEEVGHEGAGIVVAAGPRSRHRAGDRVVVMPLGGCGTCFLCRRGEYVHCEQPRDIAAQTGVRAGLAAQYAIRADHVVIRVPDDLSLDQAVMACCGFGPTFNALNRMGVTNSDTVVISGCGPVGLGGVIQATARGAAVIGLETVPYRADLARRLGATEVIDPRDPDAAAKVRALTGGRGADAAIETSGSPTAVPLLTELVRRRGQVAIVAWAPDNQAIVPWPVRNGISVHGCWHWNAETHEHEMWTAIRRSADAIDRFVTHRFELDRIGEALDAMDGLECGKVFIYPHGLSAAGLVS